MKVRIKATGEMLNTSEYWAVVTDHTDGLGTPIGYKPEEVEFLTDEPREPKPKEVDWEQRRYEIAKDVLLKKIENNPRFTYSSGEAAGVAIKYADELIKQLKK